MPSDLTFRLENAAFRGMMAAVRPLPYRARMSALSWVVRRIVGPVAGYTGRADANLAMVWPDMPKARRRRIVADVLDNLARTLVENYSQAEFRRLIEDTHDIGGPGLDPAREALAAGRPIIFSSGHYANHEATRIKLNQLGFEVGGIYRPMKNPYFNRHYVEGLQAISGPAFPIGKEGTQGFLKFLSQGGHGFLLHDVHFGRGEPFSFLGHDAMTSFATAELALKFDALLIPYFQTRLSDRTRFRIELEAPIPHGDVRHMMRHLVDLLEDRVRADPGQWFWVHRRWK